MAVFRKKSLHLDGGRLVVSEFRGMGVVPFVDLYSHEYMEPEVTQLRIYSTEFEKLKSSIQDFIDYMQHVHDEGEVGLTRMPPSVAVRTDSLQREGEGSFFVDCSRSHIWLLVRYGSSDANSVRPRTVMEKERHFPIHLAFKVEDFPKLGDLLKEMSLFFTQDSVKRRHDLLEKRLTTRAEGGVGRLRLASVKRRINLNPVFDRELEADGLAGRGYVSELETDSA